MLNSSQVLSSAEQHEVDTALKALLPDLPPADCKEAFPAADLDMQSVAQQLDSQIAPAGKIHSFVLVFVVQKSLSIDQLICHPAWTLGGKAISIAHDSISFIPRLPAISSRARLLRP